MAAQQLLQDPGQAEQLTAGEPVDDAEWARTLAARLDERAHAMAGSFAFAEAQHQL